MTGPIHVHHEMLVVALVLFGALVSSASARAQSNEVIATTPESAVTHLRWHGPDGCPSEDEVRALALERMRGLPEDAPLLLLEVDAEVASSVLGFDGTLRASDVERHFSSPSCATIARAVALVFSEWVIEGPAGTETAPERADDAVAPETAAAITTNAAPDSTAPPERAEAASSPTGRGLIRFIGGFLIGYDAFAMPVVEPTAFLSLGVGIDAFELDVGPMGLGLTNFGLGSAEDARMILYGGRLRAGLMFELSSEWEFGGHLLTEVALISISRDNGGETSRALFATFGAGLDVRFFPVPIVGIGFSVQVPFPVTKSTLSLPSVGLTYEQDWATLVMGLGVVVRIP